jgi:hypothetical protein
MLGDRIARRRTGSHVLVRGNHAVDPRIHFLEMPLTVRLREKTVPYQARAIFPGKVLLVEECGNRDPARGSMSLGALSS